MFVSFVLNFNAFCDAFTVQIQSYVVLLKSERIFCLMLGITFGRYFFNCFQQRWWSFMALFCLLFELPPYVWRNCLISSYRDSNNLNSTLSSSSWKVFIMYARCMISLYCFSFMFGFFFFLVPSRKVRGGIIY